MHILDDDGQRAAGRRDRARIYFERRPTPFEYHKDPEKTARRAAPSSGWATVGDVGYVDDEGYLYLTDRKAYMIISGGVNIYPQEVENLLVTHPKVADVGRVRRPQRGDGRRGEGGRAARRPGATPARRSKRELMEFCREHLAHYKCPRSIDFDAELPRLPTGKLYKRLLRERYWAGRRTRIGG